LPVVSAGVTNGAGWNNTDVTVGFTAADPGGSGVSSITYSATGATNIGSTMVPGSATSIIISDQGTTIISNQGTTTVSCYATDLAGNLSTTQTVVVRIDTTLPGFAWGTRTPAANSYGWNNTTVNIPWTASDAVSGVATPGTSGTATFNTQGANQTRSITVVDVAGNSAGPFTSAAINVDLDLVIQGLKDGFSGGKLLLTEDELRRSRDTFQADLRRNQAYGRLVNQKEGAIFLSNNRTNLGVVTLPSGLQYKILKAGSGNKPTATNTVECRYRGTLINGTEFDRSPGDGKPVTFKVSGVIPGWREAVLLMPAGSKWQLFIPPNLAYGARGRGPDIEPNSALIFELELVAVK
jgi:FKBP-type peptidyl-prolyl cis-trans isomerase